MADGIVVEAQDAQATEVGQAPLVQPGEVVEGQSPVEGETGVGGAMSLRLPRFPLPSWASAMAAGERGLNKDWN